VETDLDASRQPSLCACVHCSLWAESACCTFRPLSRFLAARPPSSPVKKPFLPNFFFLPYAATRLWPQRARADYGIGPSIGSSLISIGREKPLANKLYLKPQPSCPDGVYVPRCPRLHRYANEVSLSHPEPHFASSHPLLWSSPSVESCAISSRSRITPEPGQNQENLTVPQIQQTCVAETLTERHALATLSRFFRLLPFVHAAKLTRSFRYPRIQFRSHFPRIKRSLARKA